MPFWCLRAATTARLFSSTTASSTGQHAMLYKPDGVLSQFVYNGQQRLKKHQKLLSALPCASSLPPKAMVVGRLDQDSEGLLLITTDGKLSYYITKSRLIEKEYLAQVEGELPALARQQLSDGVDIGLGAGKTHRTRPCKVELIGEPPLLPIRSRPVPGLTRRKIDGSTVMTPTSWVSLTLVEGKYRQVRKMTAAVGHPTLRLVRIRVGDVVIGDLQPSELRPWHPGKALLRSANAFAAMRSAETRCYFTGVAP